MEKWELLQLSANIKYIEFFLKKADSENIYNDEFKEKFGFSKKNYPLINQYFWLLKSLPIIFIRNELHNKSIPELIFIRNSISHNNFEINEEWFLFKNNEEEIFKTFEEYNRFIYSIENNFYA